MSTMPGITSAPSASISRSALPSTVPTSAMTPPRTATSAVRTSEPVPSMTEPLRMIRSKSAMRQSRVVAASFTTRAYTGCLDRSSKVPSVVEEAGQDDPSLGVLRERRRRWWHRHLASEERQRVMTELAIRRPDHGSFRFAVMITLSVIVAVMGMSANSAAVVIGAMLLAPMMQPVLATAACIAMALFGKAFQAFGIVLFATVGSIVLAYVLSALFVNGELPNEVTSRTAPDIRDLVVALAAGTAGAYATVRKDVSSSLPGVAVAVALVPPLGAVGITLEDGSGTLARGALLLYVTNLAAIVLAASIVFVVTGFVPPRRLASTFRGTAFVAAIVAGVVVAIAFPLFRASQTAIEETNRELEAAEI